MSVRRGTRFAGSIVVLAFLVAATVGLGIGAGVDAVGANETRTGTVQGSADLDVSLPENGVEAGETETLDFFVANDGEVESAGRHPPEAIDRATEARSVRIDVEDASDAPIDVQTGEQFVGTIEDGESSGPQSFEVVVDEDAEPGEYEVDVEVTYRDAQFVYYTQRGDEITYEEDVRERSETYELTVVVEDEARFETRNVTHDVGIDSSGVVTFEVENTGTEAIEDATVTATGQDQDFFFGSGGASSETYVDDWEPGETKTVEFRAGTTADAIRKYYTVTLDVEYDDPEGDRTQQTLRTAIRPHPGHQFELVDVDHTVGIDESGTLSLTVEHTGSEPVEDVAVTATSQDQSFFFGSGGASSETFVGDWDPGETRTIEFRAGTGEEAIRKFYAVTVGLEYRTADDEAFERTLRTGVQPLEKQQYEVISVEHDVAVGDDGVLQVDVRNGGPRDVTEAAVTVTAGDQAIVFGSGSTGEAVTAGEVTLQPEGAGPPTSEAYVGDWEAGETVRLYYRTGATDEALQRNYSVEVSVDARNTEGEDLNPRTRTIGLRPLAEQTFSIDGVESSLHVGEDGTLEGTVTNTGDRDVENVVVVYDSDLSNIFPRETRYAVGSLEAGESTEFRFRIGVSEDAEPGPRQLEFTTRYRNHRDEVRLSDPTDVFVRVGQQREEFALRPTDATIEPGGTARIEVEIENTYGQTLRNVRAKLFTNSPLSSADDEAFVTEIEPGRTATLVFEVSASGGAVAKTYPVEIDFRYDDERDETKLSGTYRVPVEVTPSEEATLPPWLPLVLLGGGGAVAWRYRERLPGLDRLRGSRGKSATERGGGGGRSAEESGGDDGSTAGGVDDGLFGDGGVDAVEDGGVDAVGDGGDDPDDASGEGTPATDGR
ncbi:MAG: hypothetical protein V5A46_05050 [Haloferacaceae archaeon]